MMAIISYLVTSTFFIIDKVHKVSQVCRLNLHTHRNFIHKRVIKDYDDKKYNGVAVPIFFFYPDHFQTIVPQLDGVSIPSMKPLSIHNLDMIKFHN